MFWTNSYSRAWNVVVVVLAILLATLAVLWGGPASGEERVEPKVELVVSPWEGVFRAGEYLGDEALVEVGTHVTRDTVVGFIDLNIMQPDRKVQILAGVQGTVVEVLVEDATFVAAGQPLMVIRLDPPDTLASP